MRLIPRPILSTDNSDPENPITTHVQGIFAIDHIKRVELSDKLYKDGNHMTNSGAPTFCYRFESIEEYETYFPKVVEDVVESVEPVQPVYDVEKGRLDAHNVLNKWYDKHFHIIQNGYSDTLITTFINKKEDALRIIADPSYESVYIDGIRGDRTALEFAQFIMSKSNEYETALAALEVAQNEAQALLDLATTQQEINEIIKGFL